MSTENNLFYFHIKVLQKHNLPPIERLVWEDLPFEVRMKWNWYFKYRAALLQIKHPRCIIETCWGSKPKRGDVLLKLYENRVRAKKATITKYKNLIEEARKQWDSLFPIEEDISYIKATQKVKRLEFELSTISFETEMKDML